MYLSLLGALAYLSLTRVDVIAFIAALQRNNHAPKVVHAKRLNSVVRWVQKNMVDLSYVHFDHKDNVIIGISDAAFKKEDDEATAMRGCAVIRADSTATKLITEDCSSDRLRQSTCHILEFASKKQRHVTRSTFSAELFGCCDTCDTLLVVVLALHEVETGTMTLEQAKRLREFGPHCYTSIVCVDAMSVYSAITAAYVKAPAERSMISHVQWLRELLDHKVIGHIAWLDTRDMHADGLTKGKVLRALIHELMSGAYKLRHPLKLWTSKQRREMAELLGQ